MKETKVYLDCLEGKEYPALIEDGLWNGFVIPWFDLQTAIQVVNDLNDMVGDDSGTTVFDPINDRFVYTVYDEEDSFYGNDNFDDGIQRFSIGGRSWVWMETEECESL